jgi:transcription antitermination factor NusG
MHQRSLATPVQSVNGPTPWYAVYVRHQHEKTVAQTLSSKGFETLLPLYHSTRHWKDRTKVLSLPLFPCYVFINGGPERRLDILTTPGIYALVSSGGNPAAIQPAEIESIRRAVDSGARMEPHAFLKSGDLVRVTSGPLAGIVGILVLKKKLFRLVLSVEMLGKAAALEVDALTVNRLDREGRVTYDDQAKYSNVVNNCIKIGIVH